MLIGFELYPRWVPLSVHYQRETLIISLQVSSFIQLPFNKVSSNLLLQCTSQCQECLFDN